MNCSPKCGAQHFYATKLAQVNTKRFNQLVGSTLLFPDNATQFLLYCMWDSLYSPSYFQPFLSLSSCSYITRHSHPDYLYLTVPPFRSSVFKSVKHFDHSFAFDAAKIWNELPHDVRSAASVASFRKKLKTYLFAKAYPP